MADLSQEPPPPGVPSHPPPGLHRQIGPPSLYHPPQAPPPPAVRNPVTLIVKHVPTNIEPNTVQEIFRCVGASAVRPCKGEGKLKGVVFVDFADAGAAARARDQLHGLKILKKTLAAEFARPPSAPKPPPPKPPPEPTTSEVGGSVAPLRNPTPGPNSGVAGGQVGVQPGSLNGGPRPESIAPGLNLDYPFPPHLRYRYPPPDSGVLRNIQTALISVPRFYTQVLHLMNKMNLPPPFASVFPPPPSHPIPAPPPQPSVPAASPPLQPADVSKGIPSGGQNPVVSASALPAISAAPATAAVQLPLGDPPADVSGSRDTETETESESELESGEEGEVQESGQGKRRKDRPVEHRKRRRRGPEMGTLETAQVREVSMEGTGAREVRPRVKKATMQIKLDVSLIKARTAKLPVPPVNKSSPVPPTPEPADPEAQGAAQPAPATREALKAGQVSPEELLTNPAFKNYAPGEATPVLYVKNIAKDVTLDDMCHVFGAFLAGGESAPGAIRLMQEGRMKGQAFVTLASASLAEEAMGLTHGYSLKGKPLIVQFGRKPKVDKGLTRSVERAL